MNKLWNTYDCNDDLENKFKNELDVTPLTAKLIANRDFDDSDRAFEFLNPDLKLFKDPFLLKGMEESVERIIKAIQGNEKIVFYGDYDVDGTTGTSILQLFFKDIGYKNTISYIPERINEGYGINKNALKSFSDNGVNLLITTDCGISNYEEVKYGASLGLDIIITDHHVVPDPMPPAFSVVNPKQDGCMFPFKELAGVGVAFFLLMALRSRLREKKLFTTPEPNLKKYLDIVCIGTVADMVPLLEDNRIIVQYGLEELNNTKRPGLKALKDVSLIKKGRITTYDISFKMAPRINATGRLDKAEVALDLLTTESEDDARELALKLDSENQARREIEKGMLSEAIAMVPDPSDDKAIALSNEGWHPGVIGIVASRLVRRFSKPSVMISVTNGEGKGSVRSINNLNVLEGLKSNKEYLDQFGGHMAAAGLTLKEENIENFKKGFIDFWNNSLTDKDLLPVVKIDSVVNGKDITKEVVGEMMRLEPHGQKNPQPMLALLGAKFFNVDSFGLNHLKFKARHDGRSFECVAYGKGSEITLKNNEEYDIVFIPYIETWQGMSQVKLNVKEIRHATGEKIN